jgi:hypothetical protein
MSSVREIVRLMVELVSDGAAAFELAHGSDSLGVAQEVEAALMARLEGNLGHVVLWEQFLRTPKEVADAVSGVVQQYVDHDLVLETWLQDAASRCTAITGKEQA